MKNEPKDTNDTILMQKSDDTVIIPEKTPKKVTIDEFSAGVSEKSGIDQPKAKKFIHGMFEYIGDGLKSEDKIQIYKFGTFKKKWVDTRDGMNPQTKEKIKIPAHYKVNFTPSSMLANEVNRKYRYLKPNVLDELLTLTGVTKINPEYQKVIDADEELKAKRDRAKKRAILTLIITAIVILLLLAVLIFVPVYCYNENNKAVQFVNKVNHMFGLNNISDRLRGDKNRQEVINEEIANDFMQEARENLKEDRAKIENYEVKIGDTIFTIAAKYWQNQYLWPDLYILNKKSVSDPDLIFPGDSLEIYEAISDTENFTKKEKDNIVQAYIGVYRIYRSFGEQDIENGTRTNNKKLIAKGNKRIEDSQWTLYTAIRYDKNLLKKYKDAIYPEDIEKIKWIQKEVKAREKNK